MFHDFPFKTLTKNKTPAGAMPAGVLFFFARSCKRGAFPPRIREPYPVFSADRRYPSFSNSSRARTTSRTWLSTVRQQPPTALAPARIQRRA